MLKQLSAIGRDNYQPSSHTGPADSQFATIEDTAGDIHHHQHLVQSSAVDVEVPDKDQVPTTIVSTNQSLPTLTVQPTRLANKILMKVPQTTRRIHKGLRVAQAAVTKRWP